MANTVQEKSIMPEANPVKIDIALDTPLDWWLPEEAAHSTFRVWRGWLKEDGIDTENLPRATGQYAKLIEDKLDASREILKHVSGLLIASYRLRVLDFDKSVMAHVYQAAELEVPVFMQHGYDEVVKKTAGFLPGEVIVMQPQQHSEIRERLGE